MNNSSCVGFYTVNNDDVSTIIRYNKMINLAGTGLKILNLGDVNTSNLTKGLKLSNKVITLNNQKPCDKIVNLEKGIPSCLGMYDVIIAGEVLEHVYRLNDLMKSIKFHLVNGGRLIVSVPNVCNLRSRIRVLLGKLPSYCADADKFEKVTGYSGHVRDFNLFEIKELLESHSFMVVKVLTNGLYLRHRLIIHPLFCRNEWGDNLIIEAVKTGFELKSLGGGRCKKVKCQ